MPVTPATVALLIAAPSGLRHLAHHTERTIAAAAENIFREAGAEVSGLRFFVHCADEAVKTRLRAYLDGVKAEVAAEREHGLS